MMTSGRLRVLLADDHLLFRKGLASLLAYREDIEVVGEASDGREAVEKAREAVPDVIFMDVHMPNWDGLQAVRAIKQEMPRVAVIMLTADEEDETLFEAIKSGARGYLFKKLDPETFYEMLEVVARGDVALPLPVMAKILGEFQRPTKLPDGPAHEELTPREMDVLAHVVDGKTNKEIADVLDITENTVKKHLQSILDKLHMQNRIQAAVYAVQEGLVDGTRRTPYPDG